MTKSIFRGWRVNVFTIGAALLVSGTAVDAGAATQVTFSKDVAPILQNKCQQCHQPNSIAPMSLITYEDARPWARSIKQRVITRQMPPPKPLVTDNEWQGVCDGYGPPDLVIRSSEYTMPAQHQDVWYRPMSDIPLTEPRWAKMVEIRPTNLKGRKIIHFCP